MPDTTPATHPAVHPLRIAPGETVAIVGSTGSGKSTPIKLLRRRGACRPASATPSPPTP